MSSPIISVQQMRDWEESSWRAGRDQKEVIERVGAIVAARAQRMTREDDRILVLCGKGHNGDDGRAALAHLGHRRVKALDVLDPAVAFGELQSLLQSRPHLIIDALFGVGLNRALSEEWVKFVDAINGTNIPVLAIDVPSGLNAATGTTEGAAVVAAVTLTVGAVKRGMLLESAWPFVGRLELASEIGLIPRPAAFDDAELRWSGGEEFDGFVPRRAVTGHKGAYGHVAIIAGSVGYHGAAVLCARGAAQAHPGLISVFTQAEAYVPVASQLQGAMVHPWPSPLRIEELCTALVVGPGLAGRTLPPDVRATVKRLWRTLPQPMVIDASALDWLDPGPMPSDLVRVVTPHPGEAARMLGCTVLTVQGDRPAAVRALSERFGNCWVVLKGHQTLVGRANQAITVNSSGNPYLAQGGSGDALAGFLGGLLAQPHFRKDPGLTMRYAVWKHGSAADILSEMGFGWTIEELPPQLGRLAPSRAT